MFFGDFMGSARFTSVRYKFTAQTLALFFFHFLQFSIAFMGVAVDSKCPEEPEKMLSRMSGPLTL